MPSAGAPASIVAARFAPINRTVVSLPWLEKTTAPLRNAAWTSALSRMKRNPDLDWSCFERRTAAGISRPRDRIPE